MRAPLAVALVALSVLSAAAESQIVRPPCPPNADCVRIGAARIARTASDVRVTLDGRVLRYEITETFVNRGGMVGEADYLLPLPRGAAFEDLALEIDGELVAGETFTAERARSIYEEIVRKARDPALVEWMDYGVLRTRIFPIAPGETKRVVVRFRAVAPREGNALRIEYLAGGRTAGSLESSASPTLTMRIANAERFGTPYSPTHQIDMESPNGAREIRVRGDASRMTMLVPVREAGRALITAISYAPDTADGFALITLSPPSLRVEPVARDITFVVDVSGSMGGPKMEQAKAAGRALLATLGPADRFRLIAFSTDVQSFREGWASATGDVTRAARQWIDNLRAEGSTNIEAALNAALETGTQRERLGMILFLTDGAATVGERNADRLAASAARNRGENRIFTFGVGADVQAAMLERIALEGRGTAQFVQPNEDVEHSVSVVAQRLTAPVATNLRVRGDNVALRQIHPNGAQDLFAGQDLVLFVRYRGDGPTTLTFEGDSPAGPVRWTERVTFPARTRDNSFVAKLWAVQRVGWLSAERRRAGANPELDAELRDLGMKYGIPTELSSYLVLEPGMQVPPNAPRVERGVIGAAGGRGGPVTDFAATRAAAEQRAAKSLADAAANAAGTDARGEVGRRDGAASVRQVGDRTFLLRDGVWLDTRMRDSVRKVAVQPYSAAYFTLVERIPELKAMFALGDKVNAGGRAVTLVLDEKGAERLSASELAAIVRDW